MDFKYFSHNGTVRPVEEATVPLSNIEYAYGFGVYESIRVANGVVYFLQDHIGRLMESARIIGLEHPFSPDLVERSVAELVEKNATQTCNVKVLLIGPSTSLRAGGQATLDILCLNPLFPDKKLYRNGIQTITYEYERPFPHAKTLNMLQSYLAYRKAKKSGVYDALLINREGCITEGTRTNFFCIKGKTLFSSPEKDILLGVTRKAVLKVTVQNGYEVVQKDIRPADLSNYDGAFLTSTSSKILPIRTIDDYEFPQQPKALQGLMKAFEQFLAQCGGKMG